MDRRSSMLASVVQCGSAEGEFHLCFFGCNAQMTTRTGHGCCSVSADTYCQIVSEELHDQGAVFVGLLFQFIQLRNGIVECLQMKVGTVEPR